MMNCRDCDAPIRCALGGTLCPSCRGKRTAEVNREKVKKHGKAYFDRRSDHARGPAL